jgi:hypothetical protein
VHGSKEGISNQTREENSLVVGWEQLGYHAYNIPSNATGAHVGAVKLTYKEIALV